VDLTFDVEIQKLAVTIPEIMIKGGEVDAIVLHGAMMTGYLREIYPHLKEMAGNISLEEFLKFGGPVIDEAFELPHKYKIPFLISSFFDYEDCYTKGYQDNNIPVFPFPEKTALALGCLYRYEQIKKRQPIRKIDLPAVSKLASRLIKQAKANGQKALDEYSAKKLLACYGVPVTKEVIASTKAEALEAAKKIGYPVALKACSWEIMHKSGKGLIALNIENATQLKDNFQSIQKATRKAVPVLVQEMLSGNREFLAGMTRFAGFGAGVVFGLGGVFTEIYKDTTIRMAPLADVDVQEMFADIRARKLLEEFRGMPTVKLDKLSQIIQAVGNISLLHPEIAEIDLNPIIISGSMPIVADALIVLEDTPKT
jgi:acetyltransferase